MYSLLVICKAVGNIRILKMSSPVDMDQQFFAFGLLVFTFLMTADKGLYTKSIVAIPFTLQLHRMEHFVAANFWTGR